MRTEPEFHGNNLWGVFCPSIRQLPPRPHHVGLAPLPQSTAGRWAVFLFLFIKPALSLERGLLLPGDRDASTHGVFREAQTSPREGKPCGQHFPTPRTDLNSSALAWVGPCWVSLTGQGRVGAVQVGRAVNSHLLEASERLGKFHIHRRGSGALRKPAEFLIIFCSFAGLG